MREIDVYTGEGWQVEIRGRRVTITKGDQSFLGYYIDATTRPAIDPKRPGMLTTALHVKFRDYAKDVTPELGFARGILAPLATGIFQPEERTHVLYGLISHAIIPVEQRPPRRLFGRQRKAA